MGGMPPPAAGYRTIADAIRAQIQAGTLRPGDRLPGIRAIGKTHGVAPQTAAEALRHLAGGGWVVVAPGKAAVVADRLPDEPLTVGGLADRLSDLERRVSRLERPDAAPIQGEQGQA